ncbi:MAG: S41 family peptidase, partial [Bacteroidota bacterium]
PFKIKIIDDKAVVTALFNDSLANADDMRFGDVILTVNNRPVSEIIYERDKYICASNLSMKLFRQAWYLLNGKSDTARITFDRNGKIYQKCIHRYKFKDLAVSAKTYSDISSEDTNAMFRMLDKHTGYVNMGKLPRNEVRRVMKQMMTVDAIVFDFRNYPQGTAWMISDDLGEARKPFARYSSPLKGNPGVFREKMNYHGSRNRHPYKGKVVLLVNELTISQSEYSCMMIQAATHTTTIGSQTAGADGDIATFTFPGGYQTCFSGHGIYYPDGRETQRIGIVPDIWVSQTINGVRERKDEILDRALQFLATGK